MIVHAVPALRAGQRFVMPLMAGVAILAGIGVAARPIRRRPEIQIAATVAVAAIVATDLWARAPESVVRLPNSDALAILREEPSAPSVIDYIPEGLLAGRITACAMPLADPTRQNARESVQHHVLPAAPFRAQ